MAIISNTSSAHAEPRSIAGHEWVSIHIAHCLTQTLAICQCHRSEGKVRSARWKEVSQCHFHYNARTYQQWNLRSSSPKDSLFRLPEFSCSSACRAYGFRLPLVLIDVALPIADLAFCHYFLLIEHPLVFLPNLCANSHRTSWITLKTPAVLPRQLLGDISAVLLLGTILNTRKIQTLFCLPPLKQHAYH